MELYQVARLQFLYSREFYVTLLLLLHPGPLWPEMTNLLGCRVDLKIIVYQFYMKLLETFNFEQERLLLNRNCYLNPYNYEWITGMKYQ